MCPYRVYCRRRNFDHDTFFLQKWEVGGVVYWKGYPCYAIQARGSALKYEDVFPCLGIPLVEDNRLPILYFFKIDLGETDFEIAGLTVH